MSDDLNNAESVTDAARRQFVEIQGEYDAMVAACTSAGRDLWFAAAASIECEVQRGVVGLDIAMLPEPRRATAFLCMWELKQAYTIFVDARTNLPFYREALRIGRGVPNASLHLAGPLLSVALRFPVEVAAPTPQPTPGEN